VKTANAKGARAKLLASRAVAHLPAGRRGQWLVSFARLYREAMAATRSATARESFRLLPPSWRVKLAIVRHLLTVHRYKERDEAMLLPDAALFAEDSDETSLPPPSWPAWMVDDFQALAANEPTLWPERGFLAQFDWYSPRLNQIPGRLYFGLYSSLSRTSVDAVVICPWLKRGGADKGILQYTEHYASRGHVILITTLDADSPWLENASPGVRTVEFGKLARDLSEEEKITVLTRLLLELAPRIIHNVQSDLGWRCLAQHGRALRSNGAVLIGSVFCEEVGADGHQFGYAITYIPKVRDLIDLILTDSTPYRDTLRRRYRLPGPRVQCVPFWHAPPPLSHGGRLPAAPAKGATVLFAGRFCYQKRPDILFAVAEACKDVEFHVFGEADATKFAETWRNKLSTAPNVTLYGAYDAFNSVAARQDYQAFLYTTAFDGLPNVLLEAASHRIPIVAPPTIGGLADAVSAETAFPVDDGREAGSYVRALRLCLADPAEARRRAHNAFELVCARHSREAFAAAMDEALGCRVRGASGDALDGRATLGERYPAHACAAQTAVPPRPGSATTPVAIGVNAFGPNGAPDSALDMVRSSSSYGLTPMKHRALQPHLLRDPTISIIVCYYNEERYIARCVRSVIQQSFRDLDIIFVNDGSTDDSETILRNLVANDARVRLISHAENLSLLQARKTGVLNAVGKYILFLDADDFLETDACEILNRTLEAGRFDIVHFNACVFPDDRHSRGVGQQIAPYLGELKGPNIFLACYQEKAYTPTLWNKIYRAQVVRSAFSEIGSEYVNYAEDYYLYFLIAINADSYLGVDTPALHNYRSDSGITNFRRVTDEHIAMMCSVADVHHMLYRITSAEPRWRHYKDAVERLQSNSLHELIQVWYNADLRSYGDTLDNIMDAFGAHETVLTLADLFAATPRVLAKKLTTCRFSLRLPRKTGVIGVYYPRLRSGGAERVVSLLIDMWTKLGFSVVLFTDERPTQDDFRVREDVQRIILPSIRECKSTVDRIKELKRQL
jgi:glycosyltransferase involved in cell wall biosynthesis